jgi:hypothetical protein
MYRVQVFYTNKDWLAGAMAMDKELASRELAEATATYYLAMGYEVVQIEGWTLNTIAIRRA